jgi:GAF domain-containing protein
MTVQFSPVRRLARALVTAKKPEDITEALVDAAQDLLSADSLHITEISQDRTVAHTTAYRFSPEGRASEEYVQVLDERPSAVARVVAEAATVHMPDVASQENVRQDYVKRFQVASALWVPLCWGGEVRWVLIVISATQRSFSEREIELAEMIADQGAAGLALLDEANRRAAQADRDAALIRAAGILNREGPREDQLAALAREADLALGGDMAGVYLGDATRGGKATGGHNVPEGWEGMVIKPGEGVGGQVLTTGQAVISNAYQREVRVPDNPGLARLQTAVSVPVRSGERFHGALSVGFARNRRITQDDLQTLQAIADLVAVALTRG